MSGTSVNLDSADAIHAFRTAMGLQIPRDRSIRVEDSGDSYSTTLTEVSAEEATQDNRLPNHNAVKSSYIKSNLTKGSHQETTVGSSNTGVLGQEANIVAAARASSSTSYRENAAKSRSSSSDESLDITPRFGGPAKTSDDLDSNAFAHTSKGLDVEQRVPQNSPAIVVRRPLPRPRTPEDDFTTEEAHDCVLDVAKELALLSERLQARKNAALKSNLSPLHSRQPNTLVPTSPSDDISKAQAVSKSMETMAGQSKLSTSRVGSSVASAESPGLRENHVLPHLRAPRQGDDTMSKAPMPKGPMLPPHLRGLRQKRGMLSASKIQNNHNASLDTKECLKPSYESTQPVRQKALSPGDLDARASLVTSDQGSSKSDLDNWGDFSRDHSDRPLKTTSQYLGTMKQMNEKPTSRSDPVLSSSSLNLKNSVASKESETLKTSLHSGSSFLEKWGSKGSASSRKISTTDDKETNELEHQLVFKAWPGQTARSRPSAQIRTCHIKKLPSSSTPASICSIVFGGALERVKVHCSSDGDETNATVRFLSGNACKDFYEATANGLPVKLGSGSRETYAWVTLGRDVDVIGGQLAEQIEKGVTRCVRALPVDPWLEAIDLRKLAVERGRQLEGFEDEITPNGSRFIIWRFCDINDAVAFRGALARNEDFESCNVSFPEDPCARREA